MSALVPMLNQTKKAHLLDVERRIESCFTRTREVTSDLADLMLEVAEHDLYAEYGNMSLYGAQRWNIEKSRTYELLAYGKLRRILLPFSANAEFRMPTELQCRMLKSVDPEDIPSIWGKVLEHADGSQPTQQHIIDVVPEARISNDKRAPRKSNVDLVKVSTDKLLSALTQAAADSRLGAAAERYKDGVTALFEAWESET